MLFTLSDRFSLNPGDYLERRSTWKLILVLSGAALTLLLLITVSLRWHDFIEKDGGKGLCIFFMKIGSVYVQCPFMRTVCLSKNSKK